MPDARRTPPVARPSAAPLRRRAGGTGARRAGGLCLAGLLALQGCGLGLGGSKGGPASTAPARKVQIQRGEFGVPQVTAPDLEALAYGAAYAQAQESLCETADLLVTVRGERSRWFGAEGTALLGGRSVNNLQADFFVRALMEDGELALAHRDTSADARALAQGYVDGYNRYLADLAGRPAPPVPPACAGQPWVRPMTIYEYRRLGELQARQAGSLPFLAAVLAARLPAAGAAATPTAVPAAQAARELAPMGLNDPGVGGVAWALGSEASPAQGAWLLAQLHGPWSGSSRWRQMRLTVPGQLDVAGARMGPGVPVQVGFNADFAWSHTASAARHATLFELKLVPGDPARYLVSGQPERMRARTVSVEVRQPDGTLQTRLHTVWVTRWGPVVSLPQAGLEWTAQTAYAVQDANAWNARGTETWLALGRARSIGEAQVALQRLGTPWMATVAADRHGDTLFQDASSVPHVDAAGLQRCAPSKAAAGLWGAAGLVVLDGSRGDCAWKTDPASPSPGLTAASHLPTLERRDWVQSTGDGYWLTNPALALSGLSPLAGPAEAPLELAARTSLQRLRQGVAEWAESPQPGEAAQARLQALFLDDRNQAAALVLDDLLAACEPAASASPASAAAASASAGPAAGADPSAGGLAAVASSPRGAARPARAAAGSPPASPPSAAARQACTVLAAWDRRDHADSRGAWLFRLWWREARGLPQLWRVPFDLKNPVDTPSGLRTSDPRLRSRLLALLEQAAARVQAVGLALDVPLGAVQQWPGPDGPVGLDGGDATAGVLPRAQGPWDGAGVATGGTSMWMSVRWGPGGPAAQGLLVPGQSPDPASAQARDGLQARTRSPWPPMAGPVGVDTGEAAASAPKPPAAPGPDALKPGEDATAPRKAPPAVLTLTLPPLEAASAPPLPKALQIPPARPASAAASTPAAVPAPLPIPTIRRPEPGASAPRP